MKKTAKKTTTKTTLKRVSFALDDDASRLLNAFAFVLAPAAPSDIVYDALLHFLPQFTPDGGRRIVRAFFDGHGEAHKRR